MAKKLKGKNAVALAECCKYKKEVNEAEKKLANARKKLSVTKVGDYTNDAGDTLTISESKNMSAIDPRELFLKLKDKRIAKKFWGVVGVNLTNLKKILSLSEIEPMQNELDPIKKFKFNS